MRKTASFLLALLFLFSILLPAPACSAPPPPSGKTRRPDTAEQEKADKLYRLLKRENPRLHWNPCLARNALRRAKEMVRRGYFDHEDPQTRRNPVWEQVRHCFPCAYAGENLVKGMNTPENIHKALMQSPTHRKNIMDPRFERVGVACYDYLCVELFAGF